MVLSVCAMSAVGPHRQPEPAPRGIALLDADPDLASELSSADLVAARRHVRTATLSVPRGSWDSEDAQRPGLGFLVLRGLLIREVRVGDRVRAELVGPGDLLLAWYTDSY
jgi:hypothetical protein